MAGPIDALELNRERTRSVRWWLQTLVEVAAIVVCVAILIVLVIAFLHGDEVGA